MTPDFINGCFELGGGLLLVLNCLALYKSKQIKGVCLTPTIFFNVWGFWNLYFYPSVDAWFSFLGGLAVVVTNTTWVLMALYYKHRESK